MQVPAYRPPAWTLPQPQRDQLRALVVDVLEDLEPVAITHDSSADVARRFSDSFAIGEHYREQLSEFGSIAPGEALADTVFAALVLRPKGRTDLDGTARYGDVRITWKPEALAHATISPILSGGADGYDEHGGGLHAGTIRDLPDILTDTLVALHGDAPFTGHWGRPTGRIERALAADPETARKSIRRMLTSERYRAMPAEVILRGATPTADAIESVAILKQPDPAWWSWPDAIGVPSRDALRAERNSIRSVAAERGIPLTVDERAADDAQAQAPAPSITRSA